LICARRTRRRGYVEALDAFERAVTVQSAVAQTSERATTICRYRGLQILGEEDAAFFIGRSAFSQRLLEFALGIVISDPRLPNQSPVQVTENNLRRACGIVGERHHSSQCADGIGP